MLVTREGATAVGITVAKHRQESDVCSNLMKDLITYEHILRSTLALKGLDACLMWKFKGW